MSGLTLRAALLVVAMLAACVPGGPTVPGAPVATPIPIAAPEVAYLAAQDGEFSIPAIPLEQLAEPLRRQIVQFPSDEAPGTIIINPGQRVLYFVTGNDQAIRYGISVGRAGFEWSGVANVTNRRPWPTWTPPPEMIDRDPKLERWKDGQPGGPTNPLGARALYLTTDGVDYGYRIHGTPDWQSIGSNASSGCIRMINQDVIDLYNRVPDGAKVIVMNRDGSMPTSLTLPPPQPRRERAPAPEPEPAVAEPEMPPLPPMPTLDPDLMAPPPVVTPVAAPAVAAPAVAAEPAPEPSPEPAAAPATCVATATTTCPPAG